VQRGLSIIAPNRVTSIRWRIRQIGKGDYASRLGTMLPWEQRFQLRNLECRVSSAERDTSTGEVDSLTHLRISRGCIGASLYPFFCRSLSHSHTRRPRRGGEYSSHDDREREFLLKKKRRRKKKWKKKRRGARGASGRDFDRIQRRSCATCCPADARVSVCARTKCEIGGREMGRICVVSGARSRVPLSRATPSSGIKFVDR